MTPTPPTSTTPAQRLGPVFVELADTMVADFDVIEFLHTLTARCVQFLPVDAAGILLTDHLDHLQLVAASTEQVRLLELFQLQTDQGPCLDAYDTGEPVACDDLAAETARWPEFAPAAVRHGFTAVYAVPMRLRDQIIGALNLFTAGRVLDAAWRDTGQAMADIATIGLLTQRAAAQRDLLAEQLQSALNTRITIEQAKGMLAERHQITLEQAFAVLRDHARSTNTKLTAIAADVTAGRIDPDHPRSVVNRRR